MDHDDMPVGTLLSRREALRVLGAIGLFPLAGSDAALGAVTDRGHRNGPRTGGGTGNGIGSGTGAGQSIDPLTSGPSAPMCVVRPEQTEGPYFVDVLLERSDIRTNPPNTDLTPGLPLDLTLNVSRITETACEPFQGAVVDLWQCDAVGVYSGVTDPRFETVGERWLRGYQVTDDNGQVHFTTIYPGWYQGRTVHLHFKVRTSLEDDGREFTSQLYFDDAFTDRVFTRRPYADRPGNRTRNEDDGIFRRSGGEQLMLNVAEAGEGYRASFDLGVQM